MPRGTLWRCHAICGPGTSSTTTMIITDTSPRHISILIHIRQSSRPRESVFNIAFLFKHLAIGTVIKPWVDECNASHYQDSPESAKHRKRGIQRGSLDFSLTWPLLIGHQGWEVHWLSLSVVMREQKVSESYIRMISPRPYVIKKILKESVSTVFQHW